MEGVRKNSGSLVGARKELNFIEGTNVSIDMADSSTLSNVIDITIGASGGGGAPTDADYLVGTANGSLSNEIVVGTTPGGELGGTWATPTVDASHSGSTHAATQAAAEATAAAALTTHEGAADPHTGYRLESADHTHQSTGLQAGTLDHGLALTGLSDNDHPQYILHSVADAKGDILAASAADTFVRVAVGSDGDVLTANSAAAGGVSFQAPGAGSHPAYTSHSKFGVD